MKRTPVTKKSCTAALALALAAITSGPAEAASLTWNATDGAWDTSATNWSTGGSPTAWSQTSTTSPLNDAYFGGSGGTVTLGSTQMAANFLTFATSGYTLTGGTVYLGQSSLTGTSSVAAGVTTTINSHLKGPGTGVSAPVFLVNGVLNLGGGMSLYQSNVLGSGTLNVSAGTYSPSTGSWNVAEMNQTGGVVNMGSAAGNWIGYTNTRSVAYTLSGGTMALEGTTGALSIGRANGTNVASLIVKDSGVLAFGTGAGKFGKLIVNQGGGRAVLDIQGGSLTVGSGTSTNMIQLFSDTAGASDYARMTQSGGVVTANQIQFGGSSAGSVGSQASVALTGGSMYIGAGGITKSSTATNITATVSLGGGTLGAVADWSSVLNMALTGSNGNVTLRAADAGGTAKNITLSGALSGTGGFVKTGAGTLTLSGSNSYSGNTTLSAGVVSLDNANALPGGGNLTFSGGTLQHTANNTADLGSRIVNSGSAVSINTNGQSVSYGAIDNTNTGGLTKVGAGVLTLTGSNGYTGRTTITGGTLALGSGATLGSGSTTALTMNSQSAFQVGDGAVATLGGAAVNVTGTSTILLEQGGLINAALNGTVFGFIPTGAVTSSNAGRLASSGAIGTSGTMVVTGTGGFLRPAFTNNANYSFTFDNVKVDATGNIFEVGRGGSNNTVTITNGAEIKANAATVAVDANGYTLNVANGGSLVLNNGNLTMKGGAGGGLGQTTLNIDGGTISGVNAVSFANAGGNSSINITNGGLLSSKASTITGSNGAFVSVSGTGSHWTLNGTTLGIGVAATATSGTVQVSAGGKITAGSVSIASGSNHFIFDNGILAAGTNGTLLASNGTVSVKAGGAILDSGVFSTNITAALTENASSLGGGLTKLGSGTMTLSGTNTFTGNTTISEGRLVLADNAQLLFKIGASGVNNSINGVGAVTLNGDFNFDLSGAGTTGSWNIVDVANLNETFGSSFSVVGFTDAGNNMWTLVSGEYTYTFSEDTGMLLVVPEPNTWAMLVGGFGMLISFQRLRRKRVGTL